MMPGPPTDNCRRCGHPFAMDDRLKSLKYPANGLGRGGRSVMHISRGDIGGSVCVCVFHLPRYGGRWRDWRCGQPLLSAQIAAGVGGNSSLVYVKCLSRGECTLHSHNSLHTQRERCTAVHGMV